MVIDSTNICIADHCLIGCDIDGEQQWQLFSFFKTVHIKIFSDFEFKTYVKDNFFLDILTYVVKEIMELIGICILIVRTYF